jgi:hypothetical protein
MHFTSWNFKKGNKLRISISNSIFPLHLSTPYNFFTTIEVNSKNTFIEIPYYNNYINVTEPKSTKIRPPSSKQRNDTKILSNFDTLYKKCDNVTFDNIFIRNITKGTGIIFTINNTLILNFESYKWSVNDKYPEYISFESWGIHKYFFNVDLNNINNNTLPNYNFDSDCNLNLNDFFTSWKPPTFQNSFSLQSDLLFKTDMDKFYTNFTRKIIRNDILLKEKTFYEIFKRTFQ